MRLRWVASALLCVPLLISCTSDATPPAQDAHASDTDTSGGAAAPSRTVSPTPLSARLRWHVLDSGTAAQYRPITALPNGGSVHTSSERRVEIRGTSGSVLQVIGAGAGRRFDEVFVTGRYLVTVSEDELEETASRVTVTNLRTLKHRSFASRNLPAFTHGGSWAGHETTVAYPTMVGREYCVAAADLRTEQGETVACVPPRNGLSTFSLTPAGLGYMSFDDSRPHSCRTANIASVGPGTGSAVSAPVQDASGCKAWDVLPLPGDAVLWSEVPEEERIEGASFFVRDSRGRVHELGSGVTGSATWCGDFVWFSRHGEDNQPAAVLRWNEAQGLELVYRSSPRAGFISQPRCGGTVITLSVWGENTYRQVTTRSG